MFASIDMNAALGNRIGMYKNRTQTWTLYDRRQPDHGVQQLRLFDNAILVGTDGDRRPADIRRDSFLVPGRCPWYVRDLINNSGAIIDHIDFSAFGKVLDQSNPSEGDRMMGFAGMEQDAVTGLNPAV